MRWTERAGVAALAVMGLGAGMATTMAELRALKAIEPGQWQLRSRTDPAAARSLCVADPTALVQLRHPGMTCKRFIIADQPHMAVIQYSCRGSGYGRTMVSVETPRLVKLTTQGAGKAGPFDETFEARRTGACPR